MNVIEATPEVISAIRKAHALKSVSKLNDQPQENRSKVTKIEGNINGENNLVPAKVKSGNGLIGYTCDIFRNGLDQPPTESGLVFLANGASTIFVLPEGTILFVQKSALPIHGSLT
jgi:hypothetical protein